MLHAAFSWGVFLVSKHGSVATCHWCGIEGEINFQEIWIACIHISLIILCKHCLSQIYKILNYILIFIDILILISTNRNLSTFLNSHYLVNTHFATTTPVFLNISVKAISSILLLDEATVLTNLLVNTFQIIL